MGTTLTFKTTKTTFFADMAEKVIAFFSRLKLKTNNLSSTKVLSLEDEVERLHYILTSSYGLDDQNQILMSLIDKTFDTRQVEIRALEASLAKLKTRMAENLNLINES